MIAHGRHDLISGADDGVHLRLRNGCARLLRIQFAQDRGNDADLVDVDHGLNMLLPQINLQIR